jgi:CspA family cold shock protein
MKTGKVKWFDTKKGFGFITTGNEDIWFHSSQVIGGVVLQTYDEVEFEIQDHTKGKRAVGVNKV